MLSALDVILFNKVGTLATIKASNYIKRLVVKGYSCVEVPASVQTGDLGPSVTAHIIHFALVH